MKFSPLCISIPFYPSGTRSRDKDAEQQINPSVVSDNDKWRFKRLHRDKLLLKLRPPLSDMSAEARICENTRLPLRLWMVMPPPVEDFAFSVTIPSISIWLFPYYLPLLPIFFFSFWPHGMRDLSFPTRNQIHARCNGSTDS